MFLEIIGTRLWSIVGAGAAVFASVSPEQMQVLEAAFVIILGVGADFLASKRRETQAREKAILHLDVREDELHKKSDRF